MEPCERCQSSGKLPYPYIDLLGKRFHRGCANSVSAGCFWCDNTSSVLSQALGHPGRFITSKKREAAVKHAHEPATVDHHPDEQHENTSKKDGGLRRRLIETGKMMLKRAKSLHF